MSAAIEPQPLHKMVPCERCKKSDAGDAEGTVYKSSLWTSKFKARHGWLCLDCLFELMSEAYGPDQP